MSPDESYCQRCRGTLLVFARRRRRRAINRIPPLHAEVVDWQTFACRWGLRTVEKIAPSPSSTVDRRSTLALARDRHSRCVGSLNDPDHVSMRATLIVAARMETTSMRKAMT